MDVKSMYQFYREYFIPAYADLTVFTLAKYEEVMNGIHDAFFHVMQSFNDGADVSVQKDNINKAHNHMIRATLDCYKIMWVELKKQIDEVYSDSAKRAFCFSISLQDVMICYDKFQEMSRDARRIEMENVGIKQLASLDGWRGAISKGMELFDAIDWDKIDILEQNRIKWRSKEVMIGLAIGVASSVIGATILYYASQIL